MSALRQPEWLTDVGTGRLGALFLACAALVWAPALGQGLWEPWESDWALLALGEDIGTQTAPLLPWLIQGLMATPLPVEIAARLPGFLATLGIILLLLAPMRRWTGAPGALALGALALSSPGMIFCATLVGDQSVGLLGECIIVLALFSWTGARRSWLQLVAGTGIAILGAGVAGLFAPALTGLALFACGRRIGRPAATLVAIGLLAQVGSLFATEAAWLGLIRLPGPTVEARAALPTFEIAIRWLGFAIFPGSALLPFGLGRLADAPQRWLGPAAWLLAGMSSTYVCWALGLQIRLAFLPSALLLAAGGLTIGSPKGRLGPLSVLVFLAMIWMLSRNIFGDPTHLMEPFATGAPLTLPNAIKTPWTYRILVAIFAGILGAHLGARALPQRLHPLRRLLSWGPGIACVLLVPMAGSLFWQLRKPLEPHLSSRPVIRSYQTLRQGDETLHRYGFEERKLGYYGRHVPAVENRRALKAELRKDARTFLLIPRKQLADINQISRDTRGEHLRVLDQQSANILLVSNRLGPGEEDLNPIASAVSRRPPETMTTSLGATLNGKVELLGVDLPTEPVRLGSSFPITYYFKVLGPITGKWKIFVHVERGSHRIDTSKTDHEPVSGLYPTNQWRKGDIIRDVQRLEIPALGTPAGRYDLYIGLFRGETRMDVLPKERHDGHNRIKVGSVEVQTP